MPDRLIAYLLAVPAKRRDHGVSKQLLGYDGRKFTRAGALRDVWQGLRDARRWMPRLQLCASMTKDIKVGTVGDIAASGILVTAMTAVMVGGIPCRLTGVF